MAKRKTPSWAKKNKVTVSHTEAKSRMKAAGVPVTLDALFKMGAAADAHPMSLRVDEKKLDRWIQRNKAKNTNPKRKKSVIKKRGLRVEDRLYQRDVSTSKIIAGFQVFLDDVREGQGRVVVQSTGRTRSVFSAHHKYSSFGSAKQAYKRITSKATISRWAKAALPNVPLFRRSAFRTLLAVLG